MDAGWHELTRPDPGPFRPTPEVEQQLRDLAALRPVVWRGIVTSVDEDEAQIEVVD